MFDHHHAVAAIGTAADEAHFEAIHSYSRADALADGVLIDVAAMAREAGFRVHVALTAGAWEQAVAWTQDDNRRKGVANDEAGRLWDVLWMARHQARRLTAGRREMLFQFYAIPRGGRGQRPRLMTLKAVMGPGDAGEPVLTIMQPAED